MARLVDFIEDGLCTQVGPDPFFVERANQYVRDAQKVCGNCEVRETCLEWALDQGWELYGIWGGLSQNERQEILGRAA